MPETAVIDDLGPAYRPTRDPILAEQRAAERKARRAQAQARTRKAQASWGTCVIPGCGTVSIPGVNRDSEHPICYAHLVTFWQMLQRRNHEPDVIRTAEELAQQHAERMAAAQVAEAQAEAERQARWLRDTNGDIYFVRLNGLIKVGWSRTLFQRLKAYGPDVEVLCHYPGSRHDETNLHRQLTPYRAKGREWYEDSALIRDLVKQAIEQHGPPTAQAEWTAPKAVVRPRRRAR